MIIAKISANSTEEAMNEKFRLPFLYPHTLFKLTNTFKIERKNQRILKEFQVRILKLKVTRIHKLILIFIPSIRMTSSKDDAK